MTAYLEIRRQDGAELFSLAGERLTVGRTEDNALSLPSDGSVSRSHAVLERGADGWVLKDAGSSNGTFVNGARLAQGWTLRAGDEIKVGDTLMVFRFKEEEQVTRTHTVPEPAAPAASAGYLDISEEWRAPRLSPDDAPARRPDPDVAAPTQPPAERAPAGAEPARRGRATVRGTARGIQLRRNEQQREILAFRVDSYDASGNRLQPVSVEFRDYEGGQVGEGEEVEVSGSWSRGTLRADRVRNLSTRAEVRGPGFGRKLAIFIVVLVILAFFAFIIVSIVTSTTVENPFEK